MHRVMGGLAVAVMMVASVNLPAEGRTAPRRLSFADVATAVLRDNLQLRAAALDIAAAEAQLVQARGATLPQVTATASYTGAQERAGQTFTIANPLGPVPPIISVTLPPPDPNVLAARISVAVPLYTGGRIEAQVRLAEANVRGAQAVFERLGQQAVFAAQQAYLQILLAQESLSAARGAWMEAEENLRVARARVQAGTSPEFDVLRGDVAAATAQQELARAQAAEQRAQADLNALLDLPLDTPLELTGTIDPSPIAGTLDVFTARALDARPELAEVRARMDAARAAVELARSGGRPNVVLGANYDATTNFTTSAGLWSVTLAVTLSVFDGGVTMARVREAELRLDQLTVLEAGLKQRIQLEVRQAWLGVDETRMQRAAGTAAVGQAREAARLARVRYEAGVGTALDALSAQTTLAQAELALAATRFQQSLARMRLILAVGGSL